MIIINNKQTLQNGVYYYYIIYIYTYVRKSDFECTDYNDDLTSVKSTNCATFQL